MEAPKVWTFLYGSYLNFKVLAEVHLVLVTSDRACVYGIVATATHEELGRLYAHAHDVLGETYLPEPVVVETRDGTWRPALCYIAPTMEPRPAANDYIDRTPARDYGFPQWYLDRLESFRP
jgi:hypothetical protein